MSGTGPGRGRQRTIARGRRGPGRGDAAAPLDLLLADAARARCAGSCRGCPVSGSPPPWPAARGPVARRAGGLAAELGKVGGRPLGVAPHEKDRRFADEGWAKNPMLRGPCRATSPAARPRAAWSTTPSSTGATTSGWASSSTTWSRPPPRATTRSSTPRCSSGSSTPAAATWSRAAGASSATSPRAPRVPSMVEPDAFEVGTDLAVTPGAVVLRTDVFELIQYTPQTAKVRAVPLLIVPPTINKYYVIDLAEQRSLVEHLVANGQQVYCISWRNPDARHADWGLDTYGQAIIEAMDGGAEDLAPGPGRAARHLLRRHARLDGAGPPRRDRRPGPRRGVQPGGDGARPGAGRAARARCSRTRPRPPRRGRRRRRATSTARCWPRCSPGCGPTT